MMSKRFLCLAAVLLSGAQVLAQPVLITAPATVGPTDTTIVDQATAAVVPLATAQITVRGTTLTISGRHTVASLLVESSGNTAGVVTHPAGASFDYSGGAGTDVVFGLELTAANVTIQGGSPASRIDVSGRGFGATAGPGAGTSSNSGSFGGAGGGHGGRGADGATFAGGAQYGSISQPADLGSGGGNYVGSGIGGTGGGRVRLVVAGTLSVAGSITANGSGGNSAAGCGSGGSIWVESGTLEGAGSLAANGGEGTGWGGGSGGRIAVYFANSSFTGTLAARGGTSGNPVRGAAGTIFVKPVSQPSPDVILDAGGNGNPAAALTTVDVPAVNTLTLRGGSNSRFTQITQLSSPLTVSAGSSTQFDLLTSVVGDTTLAGASRLTLLQPLNFPANVELTGASTLNIAGTVTSVIGNVSLIGTGNTIRAGASQVRLNVAGNLSIDAGSTLNASGLGFGPTQGPGAGTSSNNGSTGGAGGGHGGRGADASGFAGGNQYGSIAQPVDPGSGGGNYVSSGIGGTGGGAIRLVVGGTFTLGGSVNANGTGGTSAAGCGSGGSIWVETGTFAGSGSLVANGGEGTGWGGGSGGRIALYFVNSTFTGSLAARGGTSANPIRGAAGTIFVKPASQPLPDVILDAGGTGNPVAALTTIDLPAVNTLTLRGGSNSRWTELGELTSPLSVVGGSSAQFDVLALLTGSTTASAASRLTFLQSVEFPANLELSGGSSLNLAGEVTSVVGDTTLSGTGNVIRSATSQVGLLVSGNLSIDAGSSINADGRGFTAGQGPGAGTSSNNGSTGGAGGGHGGRGADATTFAGGAQYGSITQPDQPGSGGGNYVSSGIGGTGGGAVRLVVGGTFTLGGSISANGTGGTSAAGCGSGGSIWVETATLAGAGSMAANGGEGTGWGGGSGGRIAVYFATSTFSGSLQARGGTSSNPMRGAAGTIYLKPASQQSGDLILNAGGVSGATPIALTSVDLDQVNLLTTAGFANVRCTLPVVIETPLAIGGGATVAFAETVTLDGPTTVSQAARAQFEQATDFPGNLLISGGSRVTLDAGDNTIDGDLLIASDANVLQWSGPDQLRLSVAGNMNVGATSTINGNGQGFGPAAGPGAGTSSTNGSSGSAGAGHGGRGASAGTFAGGAVYGSLTNPNEPGSGGGNFVNTGFGGAGGGAIRLEVAGTFRLDGTLSVNGTSGASAAGAGSGGSVLIDTPRLEGAGQITANGGNAGSNFWGAGAGGRIAIYACDFAMPVNNVFARRGTTNGTQAEDGTVSFGSSSVVILQQPPSLTVLSGRPLDFSTSATTTQPDGVVSYQWRKRNQAGEYIPIPEGFGGGRFTGTMTPVLRIDPTECEDAAAYDCLVIDSCGGFPTRPAIIIVDPVADYNDDNGVDSDDVIDYFADWDRSRPQADLTLDGGVDSDDVIFFFSRWDLGC